MIKIVALTDECCPSATYWYDISSFVGNVSLVKRDYLSQILLDEEIHDIMKTAVSFDSTPDFSRSMYTFEMEQIAYGKK